MQNIKSNLKLEIGDKAIIERFGFDLANPNIEVIITDKKEGQYCQSGIMYQCEVLNQLYSVRTKIEQHWIDAGWFEPR